MNNMQYAPPTPQIRTSELDFEDINSNGNFTGAYLDKNLYSQLSKIDNTPLSNAFFSKDNLDIIQNSLIHRVNSQIKEANPQINCGISRQSDREVMLLMVEFFYFFNTQISSAKSDFYIGKKDSVYNQVPVPATFMFSDPNNTYIPEWFDEKIPDNRNYGDYDYLKKYNPDTIPQRCVGNKHYYTDVLIYNPNVPVSDKVAYINNKFLEFLAPKVIYEVKNKLKYEYFLNDPYACFVDYPDYESDRNNKGLSMQKYYTGTEEIYKPDINQNSIKFPKLKRHLEGEKYNCTSPAKSLSADTINPRIPMGETDILFPRSAISNRQKTRRLESYEKIYG